LWLKWPNPGSHPAGGSERVGNDDNRQTGLSAETPREKKVLLAAADTFRAAAIEQLQEWADRVGVEVSKHGAGADAGGRRV